jgi:hypothetical protein
MKKSLKNIFYTFSARGWFLIALAIMMIYGPLLSQQIISNNGVTQSGVWSVRLQDGSGNAITSTGSALDVNIKSSSGGSLGTVTLGAGTAIAGVVRTIPENCTQTTLVQFSTVQVATGAGSTVTSTTSCIVSVYVNNITNSSVTFRLADKSGTPIIWVGGNSDFTIPPNSNMKVPIDGVIFQSGITAIAGTASALNLYTVAMQ